MFTEFIIFHIVAFFVILYYTGREGVFGLIIKRRFSFLFDERNDRDLMRVIAGYNAGELIVQNSLYCGNIVFRTPDDSLNPKKYFVYIKEPDSKYFGWISEDDIIMVSMNSCTDDRDNRGAIKNQTYKEFMQILEELNPDSNTAHSKKISNKEVHLS